MNKEKIQWVMLSILVLIGAVSIAMAGDARAMFGMCVLMALAYLHTTSYSMVSRSAVRDSVLYHAVMLLMSNVLWYTVLYKLITKNMPLELFIPYTVATVWGSFTGATFSKKVEDKFGITTDTKKKDPSPQSVLAQRLLLVFLGVFAILVALFSSNSGEQLRASMKIAGLVFGGGVAFSILRRSRNTSNIPYHIIASFVNSATFYFLYADLSRQGMTFALFMPYCFGSILGGIAGQGISAWVEKKIGATADKHLSGDADKFSWGQILAFVPWKSVFILAMITVAIVAFTGNYYSLACLALLAAAQQMAFSVISRARNRNNMVYHIIASIFSNGVWFLTFRQLEIERWTPELYLPYATGGAVGSVAGVGVSMGIERALHITSETKKPQVVPEAKKPSVVAPA